ncbi:MAG TPA: methyltransferase domain-containing protein [Terriglobia bacterium]|nr:methyltransferase domain-containing protein [Terriglobia bacterium]
MKPRYLKRTSGHRLTMSNYYRAQAHFYDATRWAFLYGRRRIIEMLDIQAGERVLEIGCGTGRNLVLIQEKLQGSGEVIAVDCSAPMLRKAAERVARAGWNNVTLLDEEYGRQAVRRGEVDVVVFSYSLSMMPGWQKALSCARSELQPEGRVGVVDFGPPAAGSRLFSEWLAVNHVTVDRPYVSQLRELFPERVYATRQAWGGLWSFYCYVGAAGSGATAPEYSAAC